MKRPQKKEENFAVPLQLLGDKQNLGGGDYSIPKLAYS